MEFGSQSEDRWENGRQHCAGTQLRSVRAGRASYADRVDRAKLSAVVEGAERAARTNVRIHGNTTEHG